MAIDNFPAVIQGVIEQQNFLNRAFEKKLVPNQVYRVLGERRPVPVGVGETVTRSRPGLKTPVTAFQNPSSNTGLDNGLSSTYYPFEQYQVAVNEFGDTLDLNLNQAETLIASLFVENVEQLGIQSAQSIDYQMALNVHKAAEAGNTHVTAAVTSATIHVDNIYGFDTAFNSTAGQSPGLPAPVSTSNKLAVTIYPAAGGAPITANVQAVAADGTNTSGAQSGGYAFGASGTLTLDASVTVAVGDNVVANDGAYILRPNLKATRYAMAASDTISIPLFAAARAKLSARRIPTLADGTYACICDPIAWAQLFNDQAFQIATQGTFESTIFANGFVSRKLGLTFIESTNIPVYANVAVTGSKTITARHFLVAGAGALVEAPFDGVLNTAMFSSQKGFADIRMVRDIVLVMRPPLDRKQQNVSQTWWWTGGFVCPTDVTSNPTTIATSDYSRYKRMVLIEVAG